jgi:hypothetical protein
VTAVLAYTIIHSNNYDNKGRSDGAKTKLLDIMVAITSGVRDGPVVDFWLAR